MAEVCRGTSKPSKFGNSFRERGGYEDHPVAASAHPADNVKGVTDPESDSAPIWIPARSFLVLIALASSAALWSLLLFGLFALRPWSG
jgi:hypothetical protein